MGAVESAAKKKKAKVEKTNMSIRTLYALALGCAVTMTAILVVYWVFGVSRAMIFTNPYLDPGDIPYFRSNPSGPWNFVFGAQRYGFMWFMLLFDWIFTVPLIYVLLGPLAKRNVNLTIPIRGGGTRRISWNPTQVFLGFVATMETVWFAYIIAAFIGCEKTQFCRRLDINTPGVSKLVPNMAFAIIIGSRFFFFILGWTIRVLFMQINKASITQKTNEKSETETSTENLEDSKSSDKQSSRRKYVTES